MAGGTNGLTDAVLAEYIRFLHAEGKSPATINLIVSAVKWMAEYQWGGYCGWGYHGSDNV